VIEAAILWNEPNNPAHWNRTLDPGGARFAEMLQLAAAAVRDANPAVTRVLGGISPIDPAWLDDLRQRGALEGLDAVAVHGFPVDWNLWPLADWPAKVEAARAASGLPVWVTEAGAGSFGADEVQVFALRRTVELLRGCATRTYWYSLYDLGQNWGEAGRHREAEGSSYYRHFYTGLLTQDGAPKPALDAYAEHAGEVGLVQWFDFEDARLDEAVAWFRRLGTRRVRTGLSWADAFRPGAEAWFDRLFAALGEFDLGVSFCLTPAHLGIAPHHASPPREPERFADFCGWAIDRYAGPGLRAAPFAPVAGNAPAVVEFATRKDAP
jgi:beta-xylosidase